MPCGQSGGGPTTVPVVPPEKPFQGAPGCFPGSPGEGQEELQQLAVSPLGRVGTQRQRARALRGGRAAPSRPPPTRHTASAFNKPFPDRVFIERNHTERKPETTDTVSEIVRNLS